jgi:hypothetical protein
MARHEGAPRAFFPRLATGGWVPRDFAGADMRDIIRG